MKKIINSIKNFFKNINSNKKSRILFISSICSIILLLTVTFAWFENTLHLPGNTINTGSLGIVTKGYDQEGNLSTTIIEEGNYDENNENIVNLNKPLFNIDNWEKGSYATSFISLEMTADSLDLDYQLTFTVEGDDHSLRNLGAFWYRIVEIDTNIYWEEATNMKGETLPVNYDPIEANYSKVIKKYINLGGVVIPCNDENCKGLDGTYEHSCTERDSSTLNMITINRASKYGSLKRDGSNHRRLLRIDIGVMSDAIDDRYTGVSLSISGKIFATQLGAIQNPDGIGSNYYATDESTLREHIDNALPGDNILLSSNIEIDGDLIIKKCVNLYTNGRNLTIYGNLIYNYVSKHTLTIDMSAGGDIKVLQIDGAGGDVEFNTPNSQVNISGLNYIANFYVADEILINATDAIDTDGFIIKGANFFTENNEFHILKLKSDTRLTIEKGATVHRVETVNQATNIEIINRGTIGEINLTYMSVLDNYLGDENGNQNRFTSTPQIFIDNYNTINGTIKLPVWTVPFKQTADDFSGNTKIIRQWGASEMSLNSDAQSTFTVSDIIDYNKVDVYAEPLYDSDQELIVYYRDKELDDGTFENYTLKELLEDYFKESSGSDGLVATEAINYITYLEIRCMNGKILTNDDITYINGNLIRLVTLDMEHADIVDNTLKSSAFRNNKTITNITLPDTLQIMGAHSVNANLLTHITIPASVTKLSDYALSGVEYVTFESSTGPEWPNYMYADRFPGYVFVEEPYIQAYKTKYPNIKTKIYPKAVLADDKLTFVRKIDDGYEIVLYLGDNTRITAGSDVKLNKENIKITRIGNGAYRHITQHYTLDFDDNVYTIGEEAFSQSKVTFVDFNNVQYVGNSAFASCPELTDVKLNNVKETGTSSFASCPKLANVDFGSLEIVGNGAFASNASLKIVDMPNVVILNQYAFNSSGVVIIIAPKLERIEKYSFYACSKLTTVYLENIQYISNETFAWSGAIKELFIMNNDVSNFSGLTNIARNATMRCYCIEENVSALNSKYGTGSIYTFSPYKHKIGTNIYTISGIDVNLGEYVIAGTPENAIYSVNNMTTITDSEYVLPKTATVIEDGVAVTYNIKNFYNYSFYRTTFEGTTTLTFDEENETIGTYAFAHNSSYSKQFERINMGGIKSIGGYGFANCYFLEEFTKDNKIEHIGDQAFSACYSLAEVSLPEIRTFQQNGNGWLYIFTGASSMIKFELGPNYSGGLTGNPVQGANKLRQYIVRIKSLDQFVNWGDFNNKFNYYTANFAMYFDPGVFYDSRFSTNATFKNCASYARELGQFVEDYYIDVVTPYEKTLSVNIHKYNVNDYQLNDGTSGLALNSVNLDDVDLTMDNILPEEINGKKIIRISKCCFRNNDFSAIGSINDKDENFEFTDYVASIGESAFEGSNIRVSNLKNIQQVESRAFYNCDNIYIINAPELQYAGATSFNSLDRLLKFYAPNLIEVGDQTIAGCPKLLSIYTNVQTAPSNNWFSTTSLQELYLNLDESSASTYTIAYNQGTTYIVFMKKSIVASNAANHRDINSTKKVGENIIKVYEDDGTEIPGYNFHLGLYVINSTGETVTIYKYLNPKINETYIIPSLLDGRVVTTISKNAYNNINFNNNSIIIPDSLTSIQESAFSSCKIGGSLNTKNVTSLGDSFRGNNFVSVSLPLIKTLSGGPFATNPYLVEFHAPSLTSWYQPYWDTTTNLKIMRLGGLYTLSGNHLTLPCALTIILENEITDVSQIKYVSVWTNKNYIKVDPSELEFLVPYDSYEYYLQTDLANYNLSYYGEKYEVIDESGYTETYLFEEIDKDYDGVVESYNLMLLITEKEMVIIPNTFNGLPITNINVDAFRTAGHITHLTLPQYYQYYKDLTLNSAKSIKYVFVDSNNEYFSSSSTGVLYTKDKSELIFYPSNKTEPSFTTPAGTKVIRNYAFYNNQYIRNVTLGADVMVLGNNVFEETSLLSVTFLGNRIYTTSSTIFDADNTDLIITVPYNALTNYKLVNALSGYNIVEASES